MSMRHSPDPHPFCSQGFYDFAPISRPVDPSFLRLRDDFFLYGREMKANQYSELDKVTALNNSYTNSLVVS